MNNTLEEGHKLTSEIVHMYEDELKGQIEMWIAPPFIHLASLHKLAIGIQGLNIAAQDVHPKISGAYTGEISASMIASTGAAGVIIGHSERRQYFNETDELISEKCIAALNAGLKVILCVGEKLEEREIHNQNNIVRSQLLNVLKIIETNDRENMIIAYEPVWAIGTGKTASPEQADEMHNFIRQELVTLWGATGELIPLLYGGSCNPSNAEGLFACKNIDGGLIGGASLKSRDFTDLGKILARS